LGKIHREIIELLWKIGETKMREGDVDKTRPREEK